MNSINNSQVLALPKQSAHKLIAGAVLAVAMLLMGTASTAGAATIPESKDACKNGGWQALGYKNQGQCIKAFNQANQGYGGNAGTNANVNANVGVDVSGDNNIVNVVLRFLFG